MSFPYLTIETRKWKMVKQEQYSTPVVTMKNRPNTPFEFLTVREALRFARDQARETHP